MVKIPPTQIKIDKPLTNRIKDFIKKNPEHRNVTDFIRYVSRAYLDEHEKEE